jgi:hypothetical protein
MDHGSTKSAAEASDISERIARSAVGFIIVVIKYRTVYDSKKMTGVCG